MLHLPSGGQYCIIHRVIRDSETYTTVMKAFDSIIHLWLNVEDEMKRSGMSLQSCPRVNVRSIMEIFAPWLFVACEYDDDVGASMSVLTAADFDE